MLFNPKKVHPADIHTKWTNCPHDISIAVPHLKPMSSSKTFDFLSRVFQISLIFFKEQFIIQIITNSFKNKFLNRFFVFAEAYFSISVIQSIN